MFQPVIKWSGSKRSQSSELIKMFPQNINTYYEPFCGGVCIMGYKDEYEDKLTYTIFHLGEDDAIFSMRKDGSGGINCMNKIDFVDMVSRVLSLLNNNK